MPFTYHRRHRFSPLRTVIGASFVAAFLWLAGFVWYAGQITAATPGPDSPLDETKANAVVVLTGTQDRLGVGFELLSGEHAKRMFISGVYRGVDVQQILRALRRSPREAENEITLGYGADDTAGNARETAEWMAREKLASLILVTSNFHMPRALLEFHAAMPDVDIIPRATAPASFKIDAWWRYPGTMRLIASEWTKYLAARVGLITAIRMPRVVVHNPSGREPMPGVEPPPRFQAPSEPAPDMPPETIPEVPAPQPEPTPPDQIPGQTPERAP